MKSRGPSRRSWTAILSAIVGLALAAAPGQPVSAVEPASEGRLHDVRGARLHAEVHGGGAAIVFLHGDLLHFASNFRHQLAEFARSHQVVGIDAG